MQQPAVNAAASAPEAAPAAGGSVPAPGALSRAAGKKLEYRMQSLLAWVFILLQALLVLVILFAFVLAPTRVNGSSMEPTLKEGDVLLIDKVSLFFRTPVRGSMVIFSHPVTGDELIKRIVALPGETIEIDRGAVYINGRYLDESMYMPAAGVDFEAFEVPLGCVFVLGDDRAQSLDSRDAGIGSVPIDEIDGRVRFRVSPFSTIALYL
ncbi:MAG: signal peptidase I [Clostridiales bacterium]|jgi:signal peptidase I|nr:signal peptidase I [Clostridiales bacterium]